MDGGRDRRAARKARRAAVWGSRGKFWCVLALVGTGLAAQYPPAVSLVVGALVAVPLERRYRRHPFGPLRPGLATDVLHFLFSTILKTGAIVAAAALSWLVLHPVRLEPTADALARMPVWANTALTFVALQVTYYWEHRLAHRWGFLWRFHSLHHSSQRLDWLAASRLHPLEGFFGGFVLTAPLIWLGFGVVDLGVAGVIFAVNELLIHANVRWRLPRLSRWVPTPEYHHWHHTNRAASRDTNFGWPVLDRLFGTFYLPEDRRPEVYGVDHPTPEGYVAQLTDPLRPGWPTAGSAAARGPGQAV